MDMPGTGPGTVQQGPGRVSSLSGPQPCQRCQLRRLDSTESPDPPLSVKTVIAVCSPCGVRVCVCMHTRVCVWCGGARPHHHRAGPSPFRAVCMPWPLPLGPEGAYVHSVFK